MLKALLNDECGFVISAELVLVLTIAVLSMVVGLTEVATSVITELNDFSNALGTLDQSFAFCGFGEQTGAKIKGRVFGARFVDSRDDCDTNTSCDIVCTIPAAATAENGI